ncbi:DNA-binding TFAR19-related protein, Programmed cell death protein 5-like protein [Schizosaccharomyces osmophilus]|uniref:DNA-binding TFAR19-related protein, Programmed cell death protein 5-like protein n=1 Tax=Schizosaccharomyces osmophilus TaxID=2545709 RepID=A0AAF0AUG6_9SCHI|nr:DNA-binding TFAR19-related protein, Programmed cell death protein 5-like protein [Schizosaccharomyces osmophilus]WBW71358.1 DNA-binding TFAR19-related protein, Programmed cell death protein 5-like protein [Schizosaccharomyces osmophilus]
MDEELQAIRQARLAQLKGQQQPSEPQNAPANQGQQKEATDELRQNMLTQILEHSARDRLRRIALVKPDRAQAVEELLLRMARSGQVLQKISESELIELLEQISGQLSKQRETKIVYSRRAVDDEDDWDL